MAFSETLILGPPSTSRVRYDASRQHPTRLITPETSRSSARSANSSSPSSAVLRGAPVHELLLPRTPETSTGSAEPGRAMCHSRRDSFHDPVPKPHQHGSNNGSLPSLPPLKQLFGDSISSPPGTPHPLSAGGQPAPCEPAYTTSTYKPPALYPSKKPRTDLPIDGERPFRSPAAQPVHLPRVETSDQRWPSDGRPPALSPRDYQVAQQQRRSSIDMETRHLYPHECRSAVQGGFPQPPYRTPEHTPTSSHFDPDRYNQRSEMPISRRSSINSYMAYEPRHETQQNGPVFPPRDRYPIAVMDNRPRAHEDHPMEGYVPGPYQMNQTPYFVPSHYEYQHGKARKRSNLPKRSTEIMKNWFDQNIQNPYPSEEQKVMFSNATGISMTQVSNWFINHRRRCPELRDKRDKGRPRDCDM